MTKTNYGSETVRYIVACHGDLTVFFRSSVLVFQHTIKKKITSISQKKAIMCLITVLLSKCSLANACTDDDINIYG